MPPQPLPRELTWGLAPQGVRGGLVENQEKPKNPKNRRTPILMKIHKLKQESKSTSTSLNVYLLWIYGLHYKKNID